MAYGDFEDLTRRKASDKILRYKAFNITKIQNMMDIKGSLFEWFIILLIKKRPLKQLKKIFKMKN